MKKISILIAFSVMILLQGCVMTTSESTPSQNVVKIDNAKHNQLFVRANNWFVSTFNSSKSVIQFSDKESGTISGRYLLGRITASSEYGPGRSAYATIKVQVKDGAARIIITPESFTYMKGNMYTLYTEENAKIDIERLLSSFRVTMEKEEDNNW